MSEKEALRQEKIRLRKLEERQKDMVHKAELRDLIKQFRTENAKVGEHKGLLRAADELEELLEE